MDRAALVTVTALSAAAATALMALLTNYPLALAPGMGINAFFTYTICLGAGVPWQQALGMVFVNGVHLPGAVGHRRPRTHHRRDSPLAEARHHLRHRALHRLHRAEERRRRRRQPGHVRHPRRLHQRVRRRSACWASPSRRCSSRAACRAPSCSACLVATLVGTFVPDGSGGSLTSLPASPFGLPASPAPVLLQLDFAFLRERGRVLPRRCRSSSRCCSWTCSTTSARSSA